MSALGDPSQKLAAFPLEFSLYIPLWYLPMSNNYVALGISPMVFYGDENNEFITDPVEFSLKINMGKRNKRIRNKFIKEFNYYFELNYLMSSEPTFPDERGANKIGINASAISIDSKLVGFEFEPLNIYIDVHNRRNVFFHSSVKINIGPLHEAAFYPDYILHY